MLFLSFSHVLCPCYATIPYLWMLWLASFNQCIQYKFLYLKGQKSSVLVVSMINLHYCRTTKKGCTCYSLFTLNKYKNKNKARRHSSYVFERELWPLSHGNEHFKHLSAFVTITDFQLSFFFYPQKIGEKKKPPSFAWLNIDDLPCLSLVLHTLTQSAPTRLWCVLSAAAPPLPFPVPPHMQHSRTAKDGTAEKTSVRQERLSKVHK